MLRSQIINYEKAIDLGLEGKITIEDLSVLDAIRYYRSHPKRVQLQMGELEYNLITANILMDLLPFTIHDPSEIPAIEKRLEDAGLIRIFKAEDGRVFISTTEKADELYFS